MNFLELNHGKCKTYLISCHQTRRAVLVDPIRDKIDRYLSFLSYHRLTLDYLIDTHTHSDHRSATFVLSELTSAQVVMHKRAPAPRISIHVDEEDIISVGTIPIKFIHTPGHSSDGISLLVENRVMTGDTLLMRGTGRTDFSGGDAGEQFDAITQKLFRLPEDTLVFPAHDYRGNTHSTIGDEKKFNPRLVDRTRQEYVDLMGNLGLPLPDMIQEVLQPNQSALDDNQIQFPTYAELNQVRQLYPKEVYGIIMAKMNPLLLDVREPEEYIGELGHINHSKLVPLRDLSRRVDELEPHRNSKIIVICRAGVRSTTGAAILTGLGFEDVSNLKGGMLDWNDQEFPTERYRFE